MVVFYVSRSWVSHENSGVSHAVYQHAKFLQSDQYKVVAIGSDPSVSSITCFAASHYVRSAGSGTIYSPSRVDKRRLNELFDIYNPEILVVEAWQVSICHAAINAASKRNIPIVMVSHGCSVFPFNLTIKQILRSLLWLPFTYYTLPKLVRKLSLISALDLESVSNRFYDRCLAKKYNIPLYELTNYPFFSGENRSYVGNRNNRIVILGYFSEVKNQLALIKYIDKFPKEFDFVFIGDVQGGYFHECLSAAKKQKTNSRIMFYSDKDVDISYELSNCFLLLCISITEVLPITLLEANSFGTPFLSTPVGAVKRLKGGIVCRISSMPMMLSMLSQSPVLWKTLSNRGIEQVKSSFSESHVKGQFKGIIDHAISLTVK